MIKILPEKLNNLAKKCPAPLYVVGGATRDYLAGLTSSSRDLDICAPIDADAFVKIAEENGFSARAVYRQTGTVKLTDETNDYEFTSFRSDEYVRGEHRPARVFFTTDIEKDARRRDFKANAVYYDVTNETFVDPLGGADDIRNRILSATNEPEKVFGEDGLRLLRLARQSGQTGFSPSEDCLVGAKSNAALVKDVVPERIFSELNLCLHADEKYGNRTGHYNALSLLEKTNVLDELFPELALGRGMAQRADFHDHDMLEHSLRAVLYATPNVRLAALLHDVGKPICKIETGHVHDHPQKGALIASEILSRLKAPVKETKKICELVRLHMYDFDCKTKETKLRVFFTENLPILSELLELKQADFSACKDDLSPCPTGVKWNALLSRMREERAPLSLKDLAVNGRDLLALGIPPASVSAVLNKLLRHTVLFPQENEQKRLCRLALRL